jgi:hypothetical protein
MGNINYGSAFCLGPFRVWLSAEYCPTWRDAMLAEKDHPMHSDLIARIESGDGDERELDLRAWLVFNPAIQVMTDGGSLDGKTKPTYELATSLLDGWRGDWEGLADIVSVPHLMRSVDAAMALLPAGADWGAGSFDDSTGKPWAWVKHHDFDGSAPTVPRAIIAACLRAYRSLNHDHPHAQ